MSHVTFDIKPLKALRATLLEAAGKKVHVGLFADNATRKPTEEGRIDDNPTLGAQHEFGLQNNPRRSFLEMPLSMYLPAAIVRNRHQLGDAITQPQSGAKGAEEFMQRLATVAEEVVDQAFATGGFGHWPANAPVTIHRKGHGTPLVETNQLREAIASRVV